MKKRKVTPLSAENKTMSFFASTYGTLMEEIVKKYGDEGKKLIYDAYHKSIKDTSSQDWEKITQNSRKDRVKSGAYRRCRRSHSRANITVPASHAVRTAGAAASDQRTRARTGAFPCHRALTHAAETPFASSDRDPATPP